MGESELVGGVSGKLLGMLEDLLHKLRKGVLTLEQLDLFLNKRNPFPEAKVSGKSRKRTKKPAWQREWERFYFEVFGLKVDFSNIILPLEQENFNWLLVILKGLTMNRALKACKKMFPTSSFFDDLDRNVSINDRDPKNGSYAIRLRDRVEADEELKNLSADKLKELNIPGITLLERLVLELWYFWKFQKGLDIQNWTLCTGSRDFDGNVPHCRRHVDDFHVDWASPGYADGNLRSRQAVS